MGKPRVAVLAIFCSIVACSGTPDPSTPPSPSAPTAPGTSDAPVSGVPTGETIVAALQQPSFAPPPFFLLSNTTSVGFRPPGARPDLVVPLLYSSLFRHDDTYTPVPDLADGPCQVADDQVTITCRVVEATFHDGTALTAEDVAFSFELGRRHPDCLWAFGECFGHMLESVTALDQRTVEFQLSAPNAIFQTLILPGVYIDSRAVVEAAYAPLAERSATLDAAEYQAAADGIFAQLDAAAPDCEAGVPEAESLLEAAGVETPPRDHFVQADAAFDPCMYASWVATFVSDVARSLAVDGLDAIALAYRTLAFQRAPVGSGPFRYVGVEGGTRLQLEAFPNHHNGHPATPRFEMLSFRDPGAAERAFLAGEVHWLPVDVRSPESVERLRDEPGVQFVTYRGTGFFMLAYNLREGRLFADPALRQAVELCIDKPATVDAATDGTGDVVYSAVEPASWAYQPDVPRPERDVDEARRLIEEAGWTEGPDGVYDRDGRRLATEVYVAADFAERIEFMDLVADQVRDCGIELTVVPADLFTVLRPLSTYPHVAGGDNEPFDAHFIGLGASFDPDGLSSFFHSRGISSPTNPEGFNFIGFRDAEVDRLIDAGVATYDLRERARIYRDLQLRLAELRPVLFAWSPRSTEALDPRLDLTDGEINFESREWCWQLEKLVLRDASDG